MLTRTDFLAGLVGQAVSPAAPHAPARPVRIGVVGGNFGATFQWHLHPSARVTAVCDLRDDRLARLAQVYGCGTTFKEYRDFLRHPELDAVALFTPAPLHVQMAVKALQAGKHVISAVPAGLTLEELQQLLEAVRRSGLRYMMAETSYYRPEIILCREWARLGRFGTIFYSEAEYHHEGLLPLMYEADGSPTWRFGYPPMLYPTHSTGMVVPVTGERLVEVQAVGWGDRHPILRANRYKNPFWNTTGFFKTSGGHCARVSVFWHVAAGGTERAQFYGDRLSFLMARPERSPNTAISIGPPGETVLDPNGYPEGKVVIQSYPVPDFFDRLPAPLRVKTGHGNSHTFLTHEFISAILEDRHPAVNVWEALAYTAPGIVAHQSALKGGAPLKIPDFGRAPVPATSRSAAAP